MAPQLMIIYRFYHNKREQHVATSFHEVFVLLNMYTYKDLKICFDDNNDLYCLYPVSIV